jgi:ribosomal protein S6--L-glutamate ligase
VRIGILTANPKLYSTTRIKQAAEQRGHKVRLLDPLSFSINVEQGNPTLSYNEKPLKKLDAIVPRIGHSITFFGTAVVRQFEKMGVFSLNSALAINVARDKLRSIQTLSRHPEIGIPHTVFVRQRTSVLPAIEKVGGAPVIIKLLEGTQGIGVILAETVKIAEAIIETLQTTRQNVLIQKFVSESKGRDIRAFVVGGRVVAAMRRTAKGDEFRSNVHRGGSAEGIKLDPAYERSAILAAQVHGLRVAGVDILEGREGPLVMEVNSSPGLEGIEGATGVDVASAIIEHIEQQLDFPEIDIRQRLTLRENYGVVEVPVPRTAPSELRNKTLRDSGLRGQSVLVLNITRGSEVIPTPRGDTEILGGDVLLCYGNLLTLKALLPLKKKGKKKAEGAEGGTPPEGAAAPPGDGTSTHPVAGVAEPAPVELPAESVKAPIADEPLY